MDYDTLKKLADICRKAGIKHFKNSELEFTLTDEAPVSKYKRKQAELSSGPVIDNTFESESLTDEALLLWSTGQQLESDPDETQ
jgi:hypothetical protein